jgi:SAM-dependent methyltransferase
MPGATGVDMNRQSEADVIHDLNVLPYPFEASVADEIHLDNVLEHLDDVVGILGELHRIGTPGALVRIVVPYFRSRWAAIDPTHRHAFTVSSFAYFDPSHAFFDRYRYTSATFRVEQVAFNEGWPQNGLRGLLVRYANRNPEAYEARMSHLVPLDELTVRLRVVK